MKELPDDQHHERAVAWVNKLAEETGRTFQIKAWPFRELHHELKGLVPGRLMTKNEEIIILIAQSTQTIWCAITPIAAWSKVEIGLLSCIAQSFFDQDEINLDMIQYPGLRKEEEQLSRWLRAQLNSTKQEHMLPEQNEKLMFKGLESSAWIPFLIVLELQSRQDQSLMMDMYELTEAFFGLSARFIPVSSREGLMLVDEDILNSEDQTLPQGEATREAMITLGRALMDMISNETDHPCNVAQGDPFVFRHELPFAVKRLREVLVIGRELYPEQHLFSPWQLVLERLLHELPQEACQAYVNEVLPASLDKEMELTLRTFFACGGQLSETARQLYIHRNTLIYRFDRFRQENGYDVRQFAEGLRVHLAMVLERFTK